MTHCAVDFGVDAFNMSQYTTDTKISPKVARCLRIHMGRDLKAIGKCSIISPRDAITHYDVAWNRLRAGCS